MIHKVRVLRVLRPHGRVAKPGKEEECLSGYESV